MSEAVNPFASALGNNLSAATKEAKDGAGTNAGNLEVPGGFIMKVKIVKNKNNEQISPVLKTMESGAMCLNLLLAVDDDTSEHNGKGLFASVWLMPKKIVALPDDTPAVKAQKQEEYQKKIVNTLKMNLPSIWALTGNSKLNVDNWNEFATAIGANGVDKHTLTQRVFVVVDFSSNGNKINFNATRIAPIPSMSTISQVDLIRLKDLNDLRIALGQNPDASQADGAAVSTGVETNEVAGSDAAPFLGGATVPGAGNISFSDEQKV